MHTAYGNYKSIVNCGNINNNIEDLITDINNTIQAYLKNNDQYNAIRNYISKPVTSNLEKIG